jgi:hypothetical protein
MQDRLDELLRRLVEVGAHGSVREIRELLEEIEAVRRQSGSIERHRLRRDFADPPLSQRGFSFRGHSRTLAQATG